MSGHSHFRTVMHRKNAADAARSKVFSKLAREITVAAKAGGPDKNTNASLRTVIEKARSLNMPTDNIERAIKKATGEGAEAQLEEILLEGYGPGGIALLISGITDNKNRALGEVKQIVAKYQGKLVEGGAVKWMFEYKGTIRVPREGKPKDELELLAIEAGAQDTSWESKDTLSLYTNPSELEQVKKVLEEKGIKIDSSQLEWVPKESVEVSPSTQQSIEKLYEELNENDAVQDVFSNAT